MKNKIKILSVLSIAGLTAALGLAVSNSTPAYAMPISNHQLLMANGDTNISGSTYTRSVPDSWVEQGTVEYGGIKYTVSSNKFLDAAIVDNPSEVRELILYYAFGRSRVNYNNIDFSQYTNLQDVVVVANDMSAFTSILSTLPSGVNLYTSGAVNFDTALQTMSFENLYICSTYSASSYIIDNSFKNNLAQSKIKHIYYNDYFEKHNTSNITRFNEAALTNSLGETITASKATSIKYPKEVFYLFESFDDSSSVLGGKSYYFSSTTGQVTSMTQMNEKVEEVDERVKDLVLTKIKCGNDLPSNRSYGKLYFRDIGSYNFSACTADEVIFAPIFGSSSNYLDLEYFSRIGCIRILPSTRTVTIRGEISSGSKLKKILIPQSQEEAYATLLSNSSLEGVVELYDDSTYETPRNSYLSGDELVYVSSAILNVDDAEYVKNALNALNIDYSNQAIDVIANSYEFPLKETYDENIYDIRGCTKIIVPKNIDAKDVLTMFKDVLVTNNGRTCDPTGFSIKTIDDSDYTVGYNGKLTVTVKFVDNTEKTFDVNVRTMNIDGTYGYIMDNNGNINIVGPKTQTNTELSVLLEPLMENYLMESNVEYTTSSILDTSTPIFNAANTYKAQASNGKVRVWLGNDALVDEVQSDTPSTTDTDDIDTDGYEIKNITKIYTPTTIDGSKLISGLRNDLLTHNGEPEEVSFAIGYNAHTNQEDWSFTISDTIVSGDRYRKRIDVEIIEHSLNMGFVMFEDGTIAVEYNTYERYTPAQIKAGIEEFLESQEISTEGVTIPESFNRNGVFYGTYSGGDLILVDSGYNLSYTSASTPTDQTKVKEGYKALHTIYYTGDFTIEEALRSVSRNFLLKDGKLVTDYSIEFTTKEDSKYVDYVIKDGDTELLKGSVALQKIESDYSYVFGRVFDYDYGYFVVKKQDNSPEYKLEDVIKDALTNFRGLMRPFTTETEIDFTKISNAEAKGVYELGNGSYYEYEYDVDVVDLNHIVRTNACTVDGKAQSGESFIDKTKDFFEGVKTKFEDNKAFKIGAIAIGSVTGLLILYGLFVLIKKMFKWFKK